MNALQRGFIVYFVASVLVCIAVLMADGQGLLVGGVVGIMAYVSLVLLWATIAWVIRGKSGVRSMWDELTET